MSRFGGGTSDGSRCRWRACDGRARGSGSLAPGGSFTRARVGQRIHPRAPRRGDHWRDRDGQDGLGNGRRRVRTGPGHVGRHGGGHRGGPPLPLRRLRVAPLACSHSARARVARRAPAPLRTRAPRRRRGAAPPPLRRRCASARRRVLHAGPPAVAERLRHSARLRHGGWPHGPTGLRSDRRAVEGPPGAAHRAGATRRERRGGPAARRVERSDRRGLHPPRRGAFARRSALHARADHRRARKRRAGRRQRDLAPTRATRADGPTGRAGHPQAREPERSRAPRCRAGRVRGTLGAAHT